MRNTSLIKSSVLALTCIYFAIQVPLLKAIPPRVDSKPVRDAREKVDAAKSELAAAEAEYKRTADALTRPFQETAEWQKIQEAAKAAQTNYDKLRATAAGATRKTAAYKAAALRYEQATAKLAASREASSADPTEVAKASQDAGAAKAELLRLESAGVAAEPEVVEAKARLTEASAAQAKLKREIDDTMQSDPALSPPREKVAAAKAKVEAAEKERASAAQQVATAERARQKQMADERRARSRSRRR